MIPTDLIAPAVSNAKMETVLIWDITPRSTMTAAVKYWEDISYIPPKVYHFAVNITLIVFCSGLII